MNKYRVRLKDGRVIGPVAKEQVKELIEQGHFTTSGECQIFPLGDWKKYSDFEEMTEMESTNTNEETRILSRIKKIKEQIINEHGQSPEIAEAPVEKKESSAPSGTKLSEFREFDYKKGGQESNNSMLAINIKNHAKDKAKKEIGLGESEQSDTSLAFESTRIVTPAKKKKVHVEKNDFQKTILRPLTEDEKEELLRLKEENLKNRPELKTDDEKKKQSLQALEKIGEGEDFDESMVNEKTMFDLKAHTQMFDLNILPSKADIIKAEEDIWNQQWRKNNPVVEKEKKPEPLEELPDLNKKSMSKKMSPIVAITFAILFYFLIVEDEKEVKIIAPVSPQIIFPIGEKSVDLKNSEMNFQDGVSSYEKFSYIEKIRAANFFRRAYELNVNNKVILGRLILVYSELLPNILKINFDPSGKVIPGADPLVREKAGNIIFKMIQLGNTTSLNDINMILGAAIFYSHFKKYATAANTLEKYLYLGGKSTQKFLSVYLNILVKNEKWEEAKKAFDRITAIKTKNFDIYNSIIQYCFAMKDYETAETYIKQAFKAYPQSVEILLHFARFLAIKEDFKKLSVVLKKVKDLEAEKSGLFYAKYLEYLGLLSAAEKKPQVATQLFQLSLSIEESMDLRSKLASLEIGGDKTSTGLILESKVLELIQKSKDALKKLQWEKAFSYAIDAVDLSESSVPAKFWLADVQAQRGYYGDAIETLSELSKKYPLVASIQFALIKTCIQAYKINDAKKNLENLTSTPLMNTSEYASALGEMYIQSNKAILATNWLQKSININPLEDRNYYLLSKVFLKFRKLEKSKIMLSKAITLDPANIEYKIMYAKILYEMDGAEVAIGYLEKILLDNKAVKEIEEHDIPKVMGNIAIYYHKNGQISQFERVKKELEDKYFGDKVFFQFLIETAKSDDKADDVIKYSQKIIDMWPGDLEARMILGEYILEQGKVDDALEVFTQVEKRMSTYPKVQFFLSKIHLMKNNLDKALQLAQDEIKSNPDTEYGYLLMGEINSKQEKYQDALTSYKKAQAINQESTEAIMGLASINYLQNNLESALDLYLKAAAQAPNNSTVRRQLGYVYQALGQGSLAIEAFKVYLELSPDAPDKDKVNGIINQLN